MNIDHDVGPETNKKTNETMETRDDAKKEMTGFTESEKAAIDQTARIISELEKRYLESGMTQRELAQKAGLVQPVIARLFKGSTIPRLDTAARVAHGLGYRIELIKDE